MILLINKLWKFIWMYLFVFKNCFGPSIFYRAALSVREIGGPSNETNTFQIVNWDNFCRLMIIEQKFLCCLDLTEGEQSEWDWKAKTGCDYNQNCHNCEHELQKKEDKLSNKVVIPWICVLLNNCRLIYHRSREHVNPSLIALSLIARFNMSVF